MAKKAPAKPKASIPPEYHLIAQANKDIYKMSLEELNAKYPGLFNITKRNNWKNMKDKRHKVDGVEMSHEFNDFHTFLKEIGGFRPFHEASIDRIDPTQGYVLGNLRWAGKQTQSENRTNTYVFKSGLPFPIGKSEAYESVYQSRKSRKDTRQAWLLRAAHKKITVAVEELTAYQRSCMDTDGSSVFTPEDYNTDPELRKRINTALWFCVVWYRARDYVLDTSRHGSTLQFARLLEPEYQNDPAKVARVSRYARQGGNPRREHQLAYGIYAPTSWEPPPCIGVTQWGKALLTALESKAASWVEINLGHLEDAIPKEVLPEFPESPTLDNWVYPAMSRRSSGYPHQDRDYYDEPRQDRETMREAEADTRVLDEFLPDDGEESDTPKPPAARPLWNAIPLIFH